MIKTLSPYYLEVPLVAPLSEETCTSFTLQIFVWNGLKADTPAEPIYEITKDNPTASTGSEEINISLLINDYIDFTPSFSDATELVDGNNQQWCKTQILYTTTEPTDYIPNYETTVLLLQGYGYGIEGKNTQPPTNNILLQGTEFKVNRTGKFVFPFLFQETPDTSGLVLTNVTNVSGTTFEYSFTSTFSFVKLFAQIEISAGVWGNLNLFSGTTSPQTRTVTGGVGFNTRLFALNPLTGNTIYSNEFEYIP